MRTVEVSAGCRTIDAFDRCYLVSVHNESSLKVLSASDNWIGSSQMDAPDL